MTVDNAEDRGLKMRTRPKNGNLFKVKKSRRQLD